MRVLRTLLVASVISAIIIVAAPSVESAAQQRTVRLRNAWISKYKNRATIDNVDFRVDDVKDSINTVSSGGKDGDVHMAGRPGSEIAMPMVAEMVNARMKGTAAADSEQEAVWKRMKELDETSQQIKISGVWRLWFEHPPTGTLVQGHTVPIPDDTNPDHVFEIHPLTMFDGRTLGSSFSMIKGYTAYTAATAFPVYEKLEFRVKRGEAFSTISSTKVGYNYTQFDAVLMAKPTALSQNKTTVVLADILSKKGGNSVVAAPRRLVFAHGTTAHDDLVALGPVKGSQLKVLGIPRVNLDKLMDEADKHPGVTTPVKGAYEIIVVGIR